MRMVGSSGKSTFKRCAICSGLQAEADGSDTNYQSARVWVDYADPAARDLPRKRFAVTYEGGGASGLEVVCIFESDDWAEVLDFVQSREAVTEARRVRGLFCPFLDDPEHADPSKEMRAVVAYDGEVV